MGKHICTKNKRYYRIIMFNAMLGVPDHQLTSILERRLINNDSIIPEKQ